MRQIEVTGNNQKQLEIIYNNKIHEINAALKKMYEQYNNWDAADEKTKLIMHTKEEFKRRCIDYTLEMRKSYIRKLHNVRNGYCIE